MNNTKKRGIKVYISNSDLDFLIYLENKLGCTEDWSEDVCNLWLLNQKLLKQRELTNKKTREYIAARRKINKNYARGKK